MSDAATGKLPGVARQALRGKAFLVALALLAAAALGLNASVRMLELHFRKEAVPIGRPFKDVLPLELGPWVQVSRDEVLKEDFVEALGTQEYLFCHYVNTTVVGSSGSKLQDKFSKLNYEDRRKELAKIQSEHPEAVLYLGLTYYTGKVDTVPHVPERCYTASDYLQKETPISQKWRWDKDELDVRYICFEDKESTRRRPPCEVGYFFIVNNEPTPDNLKVRSKLASLFERYGYFAKVELTMNCPAEEKAGEPMRDFLGRALPYIRQALPDWSKYGR